MSHRRVPCLRPEQALCRAGVSYRGVRQGLAGVRGCAIVAISQGTMSQCVCPPPPPSQCPPPVCDPPESAFYGGAATTANSYTPSYGSAWQQESIYGSGGGEYTSAKAPPPASSSTAPPDLGNNGSYAATFEPRLLTVQVAPQGRSVRENILELVLFLVLGLVLVKGSGGQPILVRRTTSPETRHSCLSAIPLLYVGKRKLMVGDLTSTHTSFFGGKPRKYPEATQSQLQAAGRTWQGSSVLSYGVRSKSYHVTCMGQPR